MRQYLQVDSSKDVCSVALNGASLGWTRTKNGSDLGKHDLALIVGFHTITGNGKSAFFRATLRSRFALCSHGARCSWVVFA
jgi:hypothetical protein